MKSADKRILAVLIALFFILIPVFNLSALTSCDPKKQICNPLASKGVNDVGGFIQMILEGALKIGMPLIALAIIYSGFLFVAARGNSEKLGEAKSALMYTLIGAAVLLGAWSIAKLISETVLAL